MHIKKCHQWSFWITLIYSSFLVVIADKSAACSIRSINFRPKVQLGKSSRNYILINVQHASLVMCFFVCCGSKKKHVPTSVSLKATYLSLRGFILLNVTFPAWNRSLFSLTITGPKASASVNCLVYCVGYTKRQKSWERPITSSQNPS